MQFVQYLKLSKKIRECYTTQVPVATIVQSVKFFVLPVEAKELKKCQSLLNGDSALSASTREPTLHALAFTLNCWKSFLLLFTFQLNSHLLSFSTPANTHFHTEITSIILYFIL